MKAFKVFTFFLLVSFLIISGVEIAAAIKDADTLKNEVLRLHILAESDSSEHQALKLKVRDAVLENTSSLFENAKSAEECAEIATQNISLIKQIAEKTLMENGSLAKVSVEVCKSYFPTKSYDEEITFPSGVYNAVKIKIGAAEGQNWWCVLFPQICLSTSISKNSVTDDMLSSSSKELAANKKPAARIKFKIIEELNKLFGK